MVAHVLAQNGHVDPPNLRLDSPPAFIFELLADDVSVVLMVFSLKKDSEGNLCREFDFAIKYKEKGFCYKYNV